MLQKNIILNLFVYLNSIYLFASYSPSSENFKDCENKIILGIRDIKSINKVISGVREQFLLKGSSPQEVYFNIIQKIQQIEALKGNVVLQQTLKSMQTAPDITSCQQKELNSLILTTWKNPEIDWNEFENILLFFYSAQKNNNAPELLAKVNQFLEGLISVKEIKKTVSLSEAQTFFDILKKREDISFYYVEEGCFERVMLICSIAHELGLPCQVIHILGDQVEGQFVLKSKWIAKKQQNWIQHFAPLIQVEHENGLVEQIVMDYPFFDVLVNVETWLSKLTKKTVTQVSSNTLEILKQNRKAAAKAPSYEIFPQVSSSTNIVPVFLARTEIEEYLVESNHRKKLNEIVKQNMALFANDGELNKLSHIAIKIDTSYQEIAVASELRDLEINQTAWEKIADLIKKTKTRSLREGLNLALMHDDWKVALVASMALEKLVSDREERALLFESVFNLNLYNKHRGANRWVLQVLSRLAPYSCNMELKQQVVNWIPGSILKESNRKMKSKFISYLSRFGEYDISGMMKFIKMDPYFRHAVLDQLIQVKSAADTLILFLVKKKRIEDCKFLAKLGPKGVLHVLNWLKDPHAYFPEKEDKGDSKIGINDTLLQYLNLAKAEDLKEEGKTVIPVLWLLAETLANQYSRFMALTILLKIGMAENDLPRIVKMAKGLGGLYQEGIINYISINYKNFNLKL